MTLLKVRVEIVDAPGALAALTASIAALGVDVVAIDVLELDGRTVVDELVLRLPAGVGASDVKNALRSAGAVNVLSSADARPVVDATVRAFDLACQILVSPADARVAADALARCASADTGALVDIDEVGRFALASHALAAGAPAVGRATVGAAPFAVPGGWILWVAPQVPEPTRLAVVGRRLNVRFSATEAARLRAFATLLEVAQRVQHRATAEGQAA